jgi:hypothetical protein
MIPLRGEGGKHEVLPSIAGTWVGFLSPERVGNDKELGRLKMHVLEGLTD